MSLSSIVQMQGKLDPGGRFFDLGSLCMGEAGLG